MAENGLDQDDYAEDEPEFDEPEARAEQDPDVFLDVPQLKVEEIDLEVEDLRARVSLQAEVLDLVKLNVGADVMLGKVKLNIQGVEAQARLNVRLDNVRDILTGVLKTIDRNPEILEYVGRSVESAASSIGRGTGEAVRDVGGGAGEAVKEVGSGAGNAVGDLGDTVERAGGALDKVGDTAGKVGGSAGRTVRQATDLADGDTGTDRDDEDYGPEDRAPEDYESDEEERPRRRRPAKRSLHSSDESRRGEALHRRATRGRKR